MNIYYLDASAWVKRYYQETGTDWMIHLFSQNPLFASASLGLIEVLATLARKQKAHEIDEANYEQKLQEIEADWLRFIQVQLTDVIVQKTKTLTKDYALRGADAIHLASALHLQELFANQNDHLIFVTSDLELKSAAQQSHLTVTDPNLVQNQP